MTFRGPGESYYERRVANERLAGSADSFDLASEDEVTPQNDPFRTHLRPLSELETMRARWAARLGG
jgi:hypothetical protein